MQTKNKMAKVVLAIGTGIVLAGALVTGIASAQGTTASSTSGSSTVASSTSKTDVLGDVATKADIDTYCGCCHLQTADKDCNIADWNKDTADLAMVKSMVPLSDHDCEAIVAYLAQIEPPAETGSQQ